MFKTWLLVKLTLLYALSAMVIAGLIWLVQRVPHPSPRRALKDLSLRNAPDLRQRAALELVPDL